MTEIIKRLSSRPLLFFEMILASLFGNILALVTPIFVILVLNRYISHGIDTTLITLSMGAIIAIFLEYNFRRVRYKFACLINYNTEKIQEIDVFNTIKYSKYNSFNKIPSDAIRDVIARTDSLKQIYSASNICLLLDAPFAFIFILTLYLLNPILCYITLGFITILSLGVFFGIVSLRLPFQKTHQAQRLKSQVIDASLGSPDTVRSFDRSGYLEKRWSIATESIAKLNSHIRDRQNLIQNIIRAATGLLTIVIISAGALLVVDGRLDIGAMIGANILAARALMPIVSLTQQADGWVRADQDKTSLKDFVQLPRENTAGIALKSFSGGIELRNVTFSYPNLSSTLLDQISFSVNKGQVLCISGRNGNGKTTLAKLITGLLDPVRGQILADGIDLQQIALDWWRQNIIYFPQEPYLLNGTIRENFNAFNPDLGIKEIRDLLISVGLEKLADETTSGIDHPVGRSGELFSLGVRRRIALARSLSYDGTLAILDEPTEGIDSEGASYIYNIMNKMVHNGQTIIAFSHDREIIRGAHLFLDLDEKPRPLIKSINNANKA